MGLRSCVPSKASFRPKPGGGFTAERFDVGLVPMGRVDVELEDRLLSSNADETKEVRSSKVKFGRIGIKVIALLIVQTMSEPLLSRYYHQHLDGKLRFCHFYMVHR